MITVEEIQEGHKHLVVLRLPKEFNFKIQREFRDCYRDRSPHLSYEVDFRDVTSIDSSALGMLLLLRNHCGEERARIRLSRCNEGIMKILRVSKFDQYFQLD